MKNFLNIADHSSSQLRNIIDKAKERKSKRQGQTKSSVDTDKPLNGRSMIMIFEKPSTRTRISFDLAVKQLGGSSMILNPDGIHYGKGDESLKDTARVLSEYADILMIRTSSHKNLEAFNKYSNIPVINGLSDQSHPCQVMSDILTFEEINGNIEGKTISWIGDGNNNMSNSFIEAAVKFSFNLNIGCPKKYSPNNKILKWASQKKAKILVTKDPREAVKNSCKTNKLLISLEEHNIIGGLGSAIAEIKSTIKNAPPQLFFGINDYYEKGGEYNHLKTKYNLNIDFITKKIHDEFRKI